MHKYVDVMVGIFRASRHGYNGTRRLRTNCGRAYRPVLSWSERMCGIYGLTKTISTELPVSAAAQEVSDNERVLHCCRYRD
jgi:hypothetical protein